VIIDPKSQRYLDLILLHSNDMHGNFLAEGTDENLIGGISMLSGYVSAVRAENPHALYCIAGDMLQGSLIDTEFKGISTIEIMNMLNPDVVALGNHEIDYGLSHLLFLERCAKFPIVNCNMFIKNPYTRIFESHKIIIVNEMRVLFIGIITSEVMSSIRMDNLLGSLVDVEEAAREVGRICNAYNDIDIDFTVLLTHIGFDEDCKLAALLDPEWGVDVIIGGHSHTILDHPEKVNDILIVQAGVGTTQIGRFDIVVDTDTNSVHSYQWQLVPIDAEHCPRDLQLEEAIMRYKEQTDAKYDRTLCRFARVMTHPTRYRETELGNLFADALQESFGVDVMLMGSGSIRKKALGPVVSYGALKEIMPFDDRALMIRVTGAQFKHMMAYMLRDDLLVSENGEFYQVSDGVQIEYDRATRSFISFNLHDEPVRDDQVLSIGLQEYHYKNFDSFFNLPLSETVSGKGTVLTTSVLDILDEHFSQAHLPRVEVEGRIVIK